MEPTQGTGPVLPVEPETVKDTSKEDSTAPSKSSLPRALEIRVDAAKSDLSLSFGTIGDILKSPFSFLSKPESKIELAENIFWGLMLPATLPSVLLGAAVMIPISIISGIISFVMADSTQKIAGGEYDPNPIQHYEDPNPQEYDEISSAENIDYNPLNPDDKEINR